MREVENNTDMNMRAFYLLLFWTLFSCNNQDFPEYEKGKDFYNQGKYVEAVKFLSMAIRQDETFVSAYRYRGESKLRLGEYEAAIEDFNTVLELDRDIAYIQLDRAVAWMRLEEYETAVDDLNNLIEHFQSFEDSNTISNVAGAYHNRGLLKYHKLQDTTGALLDYNQAIEIDIEPKTGRFYLSRARCYVDLDSISNAIKDVRAAISINPNSKANYHASGIIKERVGNLDGALSDYAKALELDPKYAAAANNSGLILFQKEQYDEAIRLFNPLLEQTENAYAYNNRGYAQYKLGNLDKALVDCEKSMSLDSTNSWVHHNLGLIRFAMGQSDLACAYFSKAYELGKLEALDELSERCR
ncbi:MAG: tetratricopeptide repeat protein [Bacteroidota bacterium]